MRANLMLFILCAMTISIGVEAQSGNPFELLWRLDSSGTTAEIIPEPEPEPITVEAVTPEDDPVTQPPAPIDTASLVIPEVDSAESEVIAADSIVEEEVAEEMTDTVQTRPPDAEEDPGITKEESDASVPVIDAIEELVPDQIPAGNRTLVLVLLFGVVFALLAWVLSLNRDILKKVYRAALNENYAALLFREQRFATTQYLYYIIYFVFFLTGGLFLFLLGQEYGWQAWVFRSLWSCIGLVALVYMLRHLCLNILGSTYPITKETTQFSFSILLHNILLGVGLIPVTLFLAFGPDGLDKGVAILGIAICGLVYLMRQFRGLIIGGSLIGSNFLHFFVYLCAVEILPLVTLVKFFQQ